MTAINLIMLLNFILFGLIGSQAIFYLLAMSNVQKGLSGNAYLEVRQLLDKHIAPKLKIIYWAALASSLVLTGILAKEPGTILFITSALAFIALLADILIAKKTNVPINAIINTWSVNKLPANWQQVRSNWLRFFRYRQLLSIIALLLLLTGLVFRA